MLGIKLPHSVLRFLTGISSEFRLTGVACHRISITVPPSRTGQLRPRAMPNTHTRSEAGGAAALERATLVGGAPYRATCACYSMAEQDRELTAVGLAIRSRMLLFRGKSVTRITLLELRWRGHDRSTESRTTSWEEGRR